MTPLEKLNRKLNRAIVIIITLWAIAFTLIGYLWTNLF
jgi:hypothetical protein